MRAVVLAVHLRGVGRTDDRTVFAMSARRALLRLCGLTSQEAPSKLPDGQESRVVSIERAAETPRIDSRSRPSSARRCSPFFPVTQFTGMKFLALAMIGTIFFVIAPARFRTMIGTMA